MNEYRSSPLGRKVATQEPAPRAVAEETPPLKAHGVPSVSKLFARMFGPAAARAHGATFAQTEWQETEWQDTRSQPGHN